MIANAGTHAGKLASTLGEEVVNLGEDEGGKSIAYQLARNIAVGVHQTDLIAARSIRQEVPGAVSTLSKQEEEIDKMKSLIRQYAV